MSATAITGMNLKPLTPAQELHIKRTGGCPDCVPKEGRQEPMTPLGDFGPVRGYQRRLDHRPTVTTGWRRMMNQPEAPAAGAPAPKIWWRGQPLTVGSLRWRVIKNDILNRMAECWQEAARLYKVGQTGPAGGKGRRRYE